MRCGRTLRKVAVVAGWLFVAASLSAFIFLGRYAYYQGKYYFIHGVTRRLTDFVISERRLPCSIQELCDWAKDENGRPIFDCEQVSEYVELNPLSMEEVLYGEKPYIEVKYKKLRQMGVFQNNYLRGTIRAEFIKAGLLRYSDLEISKEEQNEDTR